MTQLDKQVQLRKFLDSFIGIPATNYNLYYVGHRVLEYCYNNDIPEPYFLLTLDDRVSIGFKDEVTAEQYEQCARFGTSQGVYFKGKKPELIVYKELPSSSLKDDVTPLERII